MFNGIGKYITPKNITFFAAAVLFIIFVSQIKNIAILFFASYVIACSLNPIVDKLTRKMSRGSASGIVLGGVLIVAAIFLIPVGVMVVHQIKSFLISLPSYIDTAKNTIAGLPVLNHTSWADVDLHEVISSASSFTADFVNSSIVAGKGLVMSFVYILAGIIITYYFLADKKNIKETYVKLFPAHIKKRAEDIFDSISEKIGHYVAAQIITIASVGIIITLGLLILKVDYAVLLGVLSAVLDIVPIVGPTIAFVIIILAACKTGPVILALITLVFLFAQWAENNLIRPYVFGKFLNLHPLIIYFFLLLTAQFLGIVGVVFSPAIAAAACVLIEELYIKNIN